MIAGLAVHADMRKAHRLERLQRKQLIHAFDFLKAQDIGFIGGDELLHERQPQPDGIDVPGRQAKFHERPIAAPRGMVKAELGRGRGTFGDGNARVFMG